MAVRHYDHFCNCSWTTTTASDWRARPQYGEEVVPTATGTTCATSSQGRWVTVSNTSSAATGAGAAIGAVAAGLAGAAGSGIARAFCWDRPRPHMFRGPSRQMNRHQSAAAEREYRAGLRRGLQHEKEKKKAIAQSLKLLKSWLSDIEYSYLMEQGELELPSQYEKDVIYIVKKDHTRRVRIQKRPRISCIYKMPTVREGEACINIDGSYPIGDSLLAKIALLKTDEKAFLDTANISWYKTEQDINPYDGRFVHITERRNTGFWFVQLDELGQCGRAYETTTDLRFEHVAHYTVSAHDGVHNNIAVPGARQYFVWAQEMIQAVATARALFRYRQREIEQHTEEAARYVEREYAEDVRQFTHEQIVRMGEQGPRGEDGIPGPAPSAGPVIRMNGSYSPFMRYGTDEDMEYTTEHVVYQCSSSSSSNTTT